MNEDSTSSRSKDGHATTTCPEEKTNTADVSTSHLTSNTDKGISVPTIKRDVFEVLPAFYKSALVVLERHGRVQIVEG